MAHVYDALGYILKTFSTIGSITAARFANIIFLADWRSAIVRSQQITELTWIVGETGLAEEQLLLLARKSDLVSLTYVPYKCGHVHPSISLNEQSSFVPNVSSDEAEILIQTFDLTAKFDDTELVRFVYSTYPLRTQPKYFELDLVTLAKQYKAESESIRELATSK